MCYNGIVERYIISTHAARAGRVRTFKAIQSILTISTHAARAGRVYSSYGEAYNMFNFNSRGARGASPNIPTAYRRLQIFQLTRRARGESSRAKEHHQERHISTHAARAGRVAYDGAIFS